MVDKPIFYTGFIGALIFDLVLSGQAGLKGTQLFVQGVSESGSLVLDKAIEFIKHRFAEKESMEISDLILKMDPVAEELRDDTVTWLSGIGLIQKSVDGFIIKRTRYSFVNAYTKKEIVGNLIKSVQDSNRYALKDAMILILAEACELIPTLFPDKKVRKEFISSLKALKKQERIPELDEVNITIKSIQPQLMIGVIAAAITSVIATSTITTIHPHQN